MDRWIDRYSGCPKTGRPVWQTGHKSVRISACLVFERPRSNHFSGFQRLQIIITSEIRTICPDFRCLLFPIYLKTGRYVRFSDVCYFLSVWNPDVMSGFQTFAIFYLSENRTYMSGFQTFAIYLSINVWKPDVMSGFQMFAISYLSENRTLCPVFRRPVWNCPVWSI